MNDDEGVGCVVNEWKFQISVEFQDIPVDLAGDTMSLCAHKFVELRIVEFPSEKFVMSTAVRHTASTNDCGR